jgi:hypothetical protein
MKYPRTVREAVDALALSITAQEKELIRGLTGEELVDLHHTLAVNIRNRFGLWEGNYELLISCGVVHPDDASMVIVRAIWQALRGADLEC